MGCIREYIISNIYTIVASDLRNTVPIYGLYQYELNILEAARIVFQCLVIHTIPMLKIKLGSNVCDMDDVEQTISINAVLRLCFSVISDSFVNLPSYLLFDARQQTIQHTRYHLQVCGSTH